MKRISALALLAALAAGSVFVPARAAQTFKLGVTPGPHADIAAAAKDLLAKKGIDLELVTFTDYQTPNAALADGSLNANSFQNAGFLANYNKAHGTNLVAVAKTFAQPMGLYSNKIKSLKDLKDGATITIANDPVNESRGLRLLAIAGLISIPANAPALVTPADVTNPRKFTLQPINAAQVVHSLDDVDLGAVNPNYALDAGITKQALLLENRAQAEKAINIIAVRAEDANSPLVKAFIEAYQSPEVKAFILKKYDGFVIPEW
jgi:D-methionine transport system substrate-binding protein